MARRKRPQQTGRGRKKTYKKVFIGALAAVVIAAVLALLIYFAVAFFHLEKIEVTGNHYCSSEEIVRWIQADKYSENSLYVYLRYNSRGIEKPPAVQNVKIRLRSAQEVQVVVQEKNFEGYIPYRDTFLYFDRQGIASLATTESVAGAVYVEGMEVQEGQFQLGDKILTKEEGVCDEVCEILEMLKDYTLTPDKITCTGDRLTLHFGGIRAQIGNGGFSDKLAQIRPILDKAAELYPDISGDLHLENYDADDQSIRFEPDE